MEREGGRWRKRGRKMEREKDGEGGRKVEREGGGEGGRKIDRKSVV